MSIARFHNGLGAIAAKMARDRQAFLDLTAPHSDCPAHLPRPDLSAAVTVPEITPLAEQLAEVLKPKRLQETWGRKLKWDWEACLVEICGIVHEEGLPERQAELVQRVQDWFIQKYDDHPATSQIKTRVAAVWHRIKSA